MQQILVVLVLLLYVAFSFTPVTNFTIFSRTLFLSPGELMTVGLVFWMLIKMLLRDKKKGEYFRPPPVMDFLLAYILFAVTMLLPTLLFFAMHNELAANMPRSLLFYSRWSIALILFFYSSDSRLRFEDLRLIAWLMLTIFVISVVIILSYFSVDLNLIMRITSTFSSQYMRLGGGEFPDPNQLGEMAVLFFIIAIMGAMHEQKIRWRAAFFVLAPAILLILLLTQSREAIVTLFVAMLGIVGHLQWKQQYGKMFCIILGMLIGSVLVISFVPRVEETIVNFLAGSTAYALNARDDTWRLASEVILKYPFGIGYENLYYLDTGHIGQAHNAFLQAALVGGIIGFFVFVFFLGLLFRLLWKQGRLNPENWLIDAYLVFLPGYVVTSLVSDHFITFFEFNAIFLGLLGFVACAR